MARWPVMKDRFSMRLVDIAATPGVKNAVDDIEISGVSTDTRSLKAGELFVAIKGENFDGHEHLAKAHALGAAAALVERAVPGASPPQLIVDNARAAYGKIGALWRKRFQPQTLALTGSNGKTTVTQMIASILRAFKPGCAFATEGNFNNDIGVPLTLLRLTHEHQIGVVELGMNHPGEIAYLAGLAQPSVALVNKIGRAHV